MESDGARRVLDHRLTPVATAATIVAALPSGTPTVIVRAGDEIVVAAEPDELLVADGLTARAALAGLTPGWWAGVVAYDYGRALERVPLHNRADGGGADVTLGRFDSRLVIGSDHVRIEGPGVLPRAVRRALATLNGPCVDPIDRAGPWRSTLTHAQWQERMRAIDALLRRGDCYQINLTRQLRANTRANPVALFGRIASRHPAPYAALVALGAPAVVSASPECFLRFGEGKIESRPIKGTAIDTRALMASEKDRIENVMIVDLVRNDLDRVCVAGSVMVGALCEPEPHPGLVHLVSRVEGDLLPQVGLVDLLDATFPPASITGVPKARVLRAIETLEPVRRGAYCGALGWVDTTEMKGEFAVGIRTFTVTTDEIRLGVGGGITLASEANSEWAETELKAARLVALVDHPTALPTTTLRTGQL